ncbi:MAG: MerR family transcriptional regulator [Lachnospiraceae bacterium]|nr:MerR family transcriptional regulator [Lachnospiraceae bacterium]
MLSVKMFCDIVGVPYSSLRYFERIGLLKPAQDEKNNYREYTPKDAFVVNTFKYYRSLGFEAKEVLAIMQQSTKESVEKKLNEQEGKLIHQLFLVKEQLEAITNLKRNFNFLQLGDGYEVVTREDIYFYSASRKNEFNASVYSVFSKWVEQLPLTFYCKRIHQEEWKQGKIEKGQMDYGIGIRCRDAYLLPKEALDDVVLIKGGSCAVFYSADLNYPDNDLYYLNWIEKKLFEDGYEICGDICVEGAKVKDDQGHKGQILFIPVNKVREGTK